MWNRRRQLQQVLALVATGVACLPAAALAGGLEPTDPLFDRQWAMQSDGPLDAPTAWRYGSGEGQVVAVLDSGVDENHPDLRGALWTNHGEIPGNGVDDDHDGFVDDVHGADLVNNDGDPADDDGHGTHVAGIIAARRDGIGLVGLAPGAKIMAVKVLDAHSSGTADVVADGIRYALAHGATVINTSVNANAEDPTLDAALREADAAGVTVVASAGNNARNLDLSPSWPASSDAPNVLSVAASDEQNLLAVFSNFGSGTVDLAAPGTAIASTALGGGYEERDGTSMAAPEVAAAFALLRAAAPDRDAATLRDVLLSTARRPRGLLGMLRSGEVDPVAALAAVAPAPAVASSAPRVRARVKRRGRTRTLITWQLTGDIAKVASFRVSGAHGRTLVVKARASRGAWVRQRSGRVRVTVRDADGSAVAATTIRLR